MRHRDDMEWIVKEYRAEGITQREIEAKYDIKHCTFHYWLYKGAAHAENSGETVDHEKKEKGAPPREGQGRGLRQRL